MHYHMFCKEHLDVPAGCCQENFDVTLKQEQLAN